MKTIQQRTFKSRSIRSMMTKLNSEECLLICKLISRPNSVLKTAKVTLILAYTYSFKQGVTTRMVCGPKRKLSKCFPEIFDWSTMRTLHLSIESLPGWVVGPKPKSSELHANQMGKHSHSNTWHRKIKPREKLISMSSDSSVHLMAIKF